MCLLAVGFIGGQLVEREVERGQARGVKRVVQVERTVGMLRGRLHHKSPMVVRLALLAMVKVKPHHLFFFFKQSNCLLSIKSTPRSAISASECKALSSLKI